MWRNNPSKESYPHWLELVSDTDEDGAECWWYKATVRQDGGIHFDQAANTPFWKDELNRDCTNDDYIHICDLDDFIKRLIHLRRMAKKHFGKDWPNDV